jgi:hypothetical protein
VTKHRIYTTSFVSVYPHYVSKAEKKGRTKAEVDQIISWLTGYEPQELQAQLEQRTVIAGDPVSTASHNLKCIQSSIF